MKGVYIMKNYGKQKSTIKPNPLVIDKFSIWQYSNILEINEDFGEENEFIGFEFDMIQYDKDEFIEMQQQKSINIENQLTQTQLALVELYERGV